MEVEDFFGKHARSYSVSSGHARGRDLTRLMELLAPRAGSSALDVATGTGHTALTLARLGLSVTGLDRTPEMLAEAKKLAFTEGLNIDWVLGDVMQIPFANNTFDIVTSRRAPHHFGDLKRALGEIVRVLKPGGRFGVSDMSPQPEAADLHNSLERLRDPSHAWAYTRDAWIDLSVQAGLSILFDEVDDERIDLAAWLAPVAPERPVVQAIIAEIDRHPELAREALGLTGTRWEEMYLVKRRLILVAEKP